MTELARRSYQFGPFRLDQSEQVLMRDGRPVRLSPKVFDLLWILVENHGHLVAKERLTAELWPDTFVDDNSLNRCVSVLRKALGHGPDHQAYIQTVPKRGYRFVGDVIEPPVIDASQLTSGSRSPTASTTIRASGQNIGAAAVALTVGILLYLYATARYEGPQIGEQPAAVHRQITFGGQEGLPALSPDGTHVAYVSYASPRRQAIVRNLSGGESIILFEAPEIGGLRWSPDGTLLMLFARGGDRDGLFLVPASGGSARRISSQGPVACWSPDGSSVVVAQPRVGKLTIVNTRGGGQQSVSLRDVHRWISDVDWSGDGKRLLVVSNDEDGRYTIWTVRPDGGDQREIVSESEEIPAARWARSGDAIYYFRRHTQTYSLYKVSARLSANNPLTGKVPLLTGLETDGSFAVSGDGAALVYARVPYHSNLWKVETGGGPQRPVTTMQLTTGTSLIERPAISPDGSQVLFNRGRDPIANLYTISASGGSPKQVTSWNAFSLGGVWSSDGRSIAFASNEGGRRRVWVADVDGGTPHPLSSGDMSDSFDIAWAPGPEILYQQVKNRNYYALDARTSDERLLARDPSVGWLFSPAYAPDRRRIAVAWSRPPHPGVWVIDAEHSRETLVYDQSVPSPIGWSADGKTIFAVEGKRAAYRDLSRELGETLTEARVLTIDAQTGIARTLVRLPFEEVGGVAISPDGVWLVCVVYSSRSDVWVAENFDRGQVP
jgi:DNA-binding winged helix-turn-helix (wHTH) protein/Tol biopolymer transport system component